MPEDTTANNKRIAKNTLFLYFRMLLSMFVSLYTSRVILSVLGVVDYGINNVVGGLVVFFSFLNNTMIVSTQRFLSYDMGKNEMEKMNVTFNMAMIIHISIALIVLLLCETIGVWFLNNRMNIPETRISAANWVLQFSLVTFCLNITQAPYTACINAHERMNVYAYFSIIDVFLKLLVAIIIQWIPFDKLKTLVVLQSIVSLLVLLIYRIFCIKNYSECHLRKVWEKNRFKEMLSYAGWNTSTHFALIARTQGINLLINLFYGPAMNAARGVAVTVFTHISGFVGNLVTAINPQIVKLYASGDYNSMHDLVSKGAKYSFYLLYVLSLPLILETDYILVLWLKEPPPMSVVFCRLILLSALLDTMSALIGYETLASGNVKFYQIMISIVFLLVPIVTYIVYLNGAPVESCVYIEMIAYILALFLRPILTNRITGYQVKRFFQECFFRDIMVAIISLPIPIIILLVMHQGFSRFVIVTIASILSVIVSVYFVGLTYKERIFIKNMVLKKLKKYDVNN